MSSNSRWEVPLESRNTNVSSPSDWLEGQEKHDADFVNSYHTFGSGERLKRMENLLWLCQEHFVEEGQLPKWLSEKTGGIGERGSISVREVCALRLGRAPFNSLIKRSSGLLARYFVRRIKCGLMTVEGVTADTGIRVLRGMSNE